MKKILMVAIALCFVFAGNYETFAQKRPTIKKRVKRKLVKCRVNGKVVYGKDCRTVRLENPEIVIQPSTQSSQNNRTPDEPYGMLSTEGAGTGGGMGNGRGTGQGSGNGAGSGNGMGSGNGDTRQQTAGVTDLNVTPVPRGANENLRIISKPRAAYTDAARQNMVQGQVALRVTFLANGQIGKIVPISRLGYGLTKQAISAARGIRFEPALRNGKPYTVSKIVSYSFTIY